MGAWLCDRSGDVLMSSSNETGVSFVVPVRNGAPWLRDVFAAIWAQADDRPMEVIAVEDGSEDGSDRILAELTELGPLRVLAGPRRGAAAAVNAGVRAARFPVICQVDQDVIVGPNWMAQLVRPFDQDNVGAVQGYYTVDAGASVCARVMALDLEQRYGTMPSDLTDHVCTGNSAYRTEALLAVGLFDESLGYGYDNDMSYRLRDGGYQLVFCRAARSTHRWRDGLASYCTQQYGFGYGRLDVVRKHPHRVAGDVVSPVLMMLHPVATAAALVCLAAGGALAAAGQPWLTISLAGAVLLGTLAVERTVVAVRAWRTFHDRAALLFPVLHLVRDLVWVLAIIVWWMRRLGGIAAQPAQSMRPRPPVPASASAPRSPLAASPRVLALIPAHNEALNLAVVVTELRACCPLVDILIIDDGSRDGTASVIESLGAQWLRFPERMGIGSGIRAGLRYASRMGYDAAVRLDGDGQHRASDIEKLIACICEGDADVALGSRYIADHTSGPGGPSARVFPARSERLPLRLLAAWLSVLTGRAVTDPTCGFGAFGPRAIQLLSEDHPTGYPEPELQLVLSRNHLRVLEVPVQSRPRLGGRTSLTPSRIAGAAARVLLALVIEPLRAAVRTPR